MTSDTRTEILALGTRWAEAEQAGDTGKLGELAAPGFRLVGPFGFVLDRTQWLDRYAAGDWSPARLPGTKFRYATSADGDHDRPADSAGDFQGRPADGQFRVTHVFVRDGDRWALASMHLSQAAPPQQQA